MPDQAMFATCAAISNNYLSLLILLDRYSTTYSLVLLSTSKLLRVLVFSYYYKN